MTHWPKEDYGKFYEGDSYIILNVSKDAKNPHASWDVSYIAILALICLREICYNI